MTISRYKIMAGILGVSLGGLAVAGQCSRPDTPHRATDAPPADPKVPSAGAKPALLPALPPPALPTPASLPIPTAVAADLPVLPAPMSAPQSKLPELPTPVKADLPRPASVPTPVVIPASGTTLPDLPPMIPAAPKAAAPTAPPAPPVTVEPTAPTTSLIPAPPTPTTVVPNPPAPTPPQPVPAVNGNDQLIARPAPAQQAVVNANRFRILLRVGEGEPMFEVKSGDDLVLRVVCEKVDVKSPEKGQGPSSVVASGRVRFVGFGAEGTCDSLSFQAGSGEVAMTGAVRVQVKDRIGRVESELTSDRLQYRLDANALPGTLRP